MEFTQEMFEDFLSSGVMKIPANTPQYDWPRAPEFFLALLGWVMQHREYIAFIPEPAVDLTQEFWASFEYRRQDEPPIPRSSGDQPPPASS